MKASRCTRCHGRGKVARMVYKDDVLISTFRWEPCRRCKGTGYHSVQMGDTPQEDAFWLKPVDEAIFRVAKQPVKIRL